MYVYTHTHTFMSDAINLFNICKECECKRTILWTIQAYLMFNVYVEHNFEPVKWGFIVNGDNRRNVDEKPGILKL